MAAVSQKSARSVFLDLISVLFSLKTGSTEQFLFVPYMRDKVVGSLELSLDFWKETDNH